MMQTAKQEALEAIQRLPDDMDTEEMIYRLYVLENVRRGQQLFGDLLNVITDP